MLRDGAPPTEAAGRPGEPLVFDDLRLVVRETPYWVKFLVVSERGTGLLYAGFAVAAVAMIWRLLFYRREILGELVRVENGASLYLAGRSEFYRSLAEEEFAALCRELSERFPPAS